MQRVIYRTASIIILTLSIIFMYQETPAQTKSSNNAEKAEPVAAQTAPDISYTVSMSKPWTHLLEVEMRVRWQQMPAQLQLKMPVWTPGSYLVREYARHVQDFAARGNNRDLSWTKVNKNTWQITTSGAREVIVTYQVYSNELTVRTNELNDEHAFWNNTALLMFPASQLKAASTIRVNPYRNWRIATGLPSTGPNTFRADNYDVLYDSPFEVSDFKETTFTVRGKPHRYVFTGEGNYDLKRIAQDTAKIVEECFKIFGDLPYENYTFIVNLRGGGGLEHMNSTALQWNRFGFKPEPRYRDFLSLVAHEFFHLWNVKRIRPDVLGPFDYENENYTRLLWVAEGATSYYEGVLLRRAGLLGDRDFLESKASAIQALQARPGRFETSLEEASFDAWIKYYRQDENAINNQISYYDKGDIVHMMLDVTIRSASGGSKSLDDVMRYLYNEFSKKGRNYTPQDYQRAAELAAGRSLEDFFDKYVRGTSEIDYSAIVQPLGLRMIATEPFRGRAYIGADLTDDGGRLNIRSIPSDTPAFEQGLNTGDQIVAIDGYRASQSFLNSYLNEKKPNDKVRLTLFRFDKMREVDFVLGENKRRNYAFVPVEAPSADQARLYQGYLGAALQ